MLDVFTVEAIPVEVAPPQLAQPPVETVPPVPPVPSPGDLGQPAVTFSPSTVEMGQVTQGSVAIPNLADFPFTARVRIPQGPWPSAALAPEGRYDALKFIDNADTRQAVYRNWDADVFEVSP